MGYWGNEEATRKAYRPNPLAPPELCRYPKKILVRDELPKTGSGGSPGS